MEKQIEDAMSKTNNEQFTCDECDFNQDISLYVSINAKQNPELKENIINKNLNIYKCSKCGFETYVNYPLLYYDTEKKIMVCMLIDGISPYDLLDDFISPLGNIMEHPYQLRTVYSYNQLIEKILIFDECLDDREFEYFKNVIRVVKCEENEQANTKFYFNTCRINDDNKKEMIIVKISDKDIEYLSIPWDRYINIIKEIPTDLNIPKNEINQWLHVDEFYWVEPDSLIHDEWPGIKNDSRGSNYEGEFNSGDRNGLGAYIYPHGEVYIGQCKNGAPHGYGTLSFPEGNKYIGEIKNNMYNGQGALYYCAVSNYTGEFKNDKLHGQGTLTLPNGSKHTGLWENNLLLEQFESDTYFHFASGIEFPKKLAEMEMKCVFNYELTTPGLGIDVKYGTLNIWTDIFIYNLGFDKIPDGIESDIIRKHFEGVIGDIYKAYEQGIYDAVVKLAENEETHGTIAKKIDFLSAYLITSKSGEKNFSHIYLSGYNNNFIKIRFSYYEDMEDKGPEVLLVLLDEIIQILDNSMLASRYEH
ncbi:MAG: hypothetical protein JRJ76_14160 [Deltaproteobacteria bacterium]|nr:hypothetical protein [Deltaproteobacteria bacterium]